MMATKMETVLPTPPAIKEEEPQPPPTHREYQSR